MEYEDRTLICEYCCKEFLFSAAEQLFFASKSFHNLPKHCRECRAKRAGARGKVGRLTESRVICAECAKETVVPFLPRKNLMVFCRQCFQKQPRGGNDKSKDQVMEETKSRGRAAS